MCTEGSGSTGADVDFVFRRHVLLDEVREGTIGCCTDL
jgi:hypothetical protein